MGKVEDGSEVGGVSSVFVGEGGSAVGVWVLVTVGMGVTVAGGVGLLSSAVAFEVGGISTVFVGAGGRGVRV